MARAPVDHRRGNSARWRGKEEGERRPSDRPSASKQAKSAGSDHRRQPLGRVLGRVRVARAASASVSVSASRRVVPTSNTAGLAWLAGTAGRPDSRHGRPLRGEGSGGASNDIFGPADEGDRLSAGAAFDGTGRHGLADAGQRAPPLVGSHQPKGRDGDNHAAAATAAAAATSASVWDTYRPKCERVLPSSRRMGWKGRKMDRKSRTATATTTSWTGLESARTSGRMRGAAKGAGADNHCTRPGRAGPGRTGGEARLRGRRGFPAYF
jgi:hypothetical protein